MEDSKIGWCDHTLNFWWGCQKLGPGCANCYAEILSRRFNKGQFGPAETTSRHITSAPWKEVVRWNARATKPELVFVSSMSDFFEKHSGIHQARRCACDLIQTLDSLRFLLLTKRPENILRFVPEYWEDAWPSHIWTGASVENQEKLDIRKRRLLANPSPVHFLSVEPLLEQIDLKLYEYFGKPGKEPAKIDWVIVGGESGPKARECKIGWIYDIVEQCRFYGVPVFVKQLGGTSDKREQLEDLPTDLRIREFPLQLQRKVKK